MGGDEEKRPALERMLSTAEMENDELPVPISKRRCTDVLFLLIFMLYWLGMVVVLILGLRQGDPNRLIYGSDYNGNLCGSDNAPDGTNKTDSQFVVYPRVALDAIAQGAELLSEPWNLEFFAVCAEGCPIEGEYVCTDEAEAAVAEFVNATDGATRVSTIESCTDNPLVDVIPLELTACPSTVIRSGCWETLFNTTSVLFRCLPNYFYEVEVLPESGCVQYENSTNLLGQVTEVCVKYRKVTKTTTIEPTASDLLFDSFNSVARVFNNYLGDLLKAWPVILTAGLGTAFVVGFAYIVALWCCVGIVIWTSIAGVLVASTAFTIYCYLKAGLIESEAINDLLNTLSSSVATATTRVEEITGDILNSPDEPDTSVNATSTVAVSTEIQPLAFEASQNYQQQFTVMAYVMTAVTLLLVLLVLGLSGKIAKAISIFREASHAIRDNPGITVLPSLALVLVMCSVLYWAGATAYIATAGEYTIQELNNTVIDPDQALFETQTFGKVSYSNFFVFYLFFGMLWTNAFIDSVLIMIIAGVVASWYWKSSELAGNHVHKRHPVLRSMYVTFRFHLGSLALGSMMVAIVQLFRYVAAYLQARMEAIQQDSRVVRVLLCCLQCFLKCLEMCIKYISRNAFIQAAVTGSSFCTSTREAFVSITANLAQVATITFLGDIISRFGQIFITLCAGLFCWTYLDNVAVYQYGGEKELYSRLFPVFMCMLLAWFAGATVLSAFDISVDTILLQFCMDKKLQKLKNAHKPGGSMRINNFYENQGDPSKANRKSRKSTRKSVAEAMDKHN